MKKFNYIFVGECLIVVVLLLLIGILVRDERTTKREEKIMVSSVEVQEEENERVYIEQSNHEMENAEEQKSDLSQGSAIEQSNDTEQEMQLASENGNYVNSISDNTASGIEDDRVKIVVFGDSIWNAGRGTDGISEQVMEALDVKIYNCSIGGTTAAVDGESTRHDEWTSRSFNGMMYVANGIVDAENLMPEDAACDIVETVDFNEVDYVIVSYGLNDYFSDIPIYPKTYYDMTSYVGALRHGVHKLKEKYPQIEFILTSPTYCEWFKGERQFELGSYVEAARSVAQEMDTYFLDMYHALGSNPEEKMEYLSDGVHLNAEGRKLYAHSVIEFLKNMEK